jgi:hypothetical protein
VLAMAPVKAVDGTESPGLPVASWRPLGNQRSEILDVPVEFESSRCAI